MSTVLKHARRANGFSLIELMIALVIGLLVVAAAGAIFISNSQTFRATQNLARVQESSRSAFEIMARDLREAGANPCNSDLPVTVLLKTPVNAFWTDWDNGIRGYGAAEFANPLQASGAGAGDRVAGTDAVEVKLATGTGGQVSAVMGSKAASLTVDSSTGIAVNDVAMVCDFSLVSVFQATAVGANQISHDKGANCSDGFADINKDPCGGGPATAAAWHRYGTDAVLAVPRALRWYIGNNGRGSTSLYRAEIRGNTLATPDKQEIVEGVSGMQLSYLVAGAADYVAAASVASADWSKVTAVRIKATLTKAKVAATGEKSGLDQDLSRQLEHTVSLRNHLL